MPNYTALLTALRNANLQNIHGQMVFLINNTQASQFDLLDLAEDLSKEEITQEDVDLSRLLVHEIYEGDSSSNFLEERELRIKNSITSLNEALIGANFIKNKTPHESVKESVNEIVKKDYNSPPDPKKFPPKIQKTVAEGIAQYLLVKEYTDPFLGNDLQRMQDALQNFAPDLSDDSIQTIKNVLAAEKKRTQNILNTIGLLQEEIDNYTQAIDELSLQITELETQILADENTLKRFDQLEAQITADIRKLERYEDLESEIATLEELLKTILENHQRISGKLEIIKSTEPKLLPPRTTYFEELSQYQSLLLSLITQQEENLLLLGSSEESLQQKLINKKTTLTEINNSENSPQALKERLTANNEELASINPAKITTRLNTQKLQLYELEIDRTSLSGKRTRATEALKKIKIEQLNEQLNKKIEVIDQAISTIQPKVTHSKSFWSFSAIKAYITSWFTKANQSLEQKQTPSPQKESLFSLRLLSCFRAGSKEEQSSNSTFLSIISKISSSQKKPEQTNTYEPPSPSR